VILLGLSIPQTKKARYLLPLMPALAARAAYPFVAAGDRPLALLRRLVKAFLLVLPGAAMLLLWGGNYYAQRHGLPLPPHWLPALAALALSQLALLIAQRYIAAPQRDVAVAAGAALALWAAMVLVVEPAQLRIHDTRAFVHATEQLRQARPAPIVLYGMGRDAEAIKYLVNVDGDIQPLFYRRPDELIAARRPLYLMIAARRVGELRAAGVRGLQPLLAGRFDNKPYALFYLDPIRAGAAISPGG
jgi:hypothetical protein